MTFLSSSPVLCTGPVRNAVFVALKTARRILTPRSLANGSARHEDRQDQTVPGADPATSDAPRRRADPGFPAAGSSAVNMTGGRKSARHCFYGTFIASRGQPDDHSPRRLMVKLEAHAKPFCCIAWRSNQPRASRP